MSKRTEIRVPDIGDFEKVPVIEVLVAEGDTIEVEQSLVTLESDKATMEVPAPASGTLVTLTVQEGDEVSEGDVIGELELADDAAALFDDVAGALDGALPEVFALDATLPPLPDESGPLAPEFIATLSPEGQVLLRGRVSSARTRDTATSLAQARFAGGAVHVTARVAEGLPAGWSMRVLLGIEALAHLDSGAVTVTPDTVDVRGKSGSKEAGTAIAQLLADRLGGSARYDLDVSYVEQLDPVAALPTPEECEARIAAVQDERKIGFEPGSARIDGTGAVILDEIAAILKECGEIRMEVAGHTDSQGREEMNARLSLERARAVLDELRLRRVLTSGLEAEGYGESRPIADNDTAQGRETNRRIEFRLIRPEPAPEEQTALESEVDTGEEGDGTGDEGQDRSADEQD